MARRAIKTERKPGDPVEFKHVVELSSRLDEKDAQIVGNIWNDMQSAKGELKTARGRMSELEALLEAVTEELGKMTLAYEMSEGLRSGALTDPGGG